MINENRSVTEEDLRQMRRYTVAGDTEWSIKLACKKFGLSHGQGSRFIQFVKVTPLDKLIQIFAMPMESYIVALDRVSDKAYLISENHPKSIRLSDGSFYQSLDILGRFFSQREAEEFLENYRGKSHSD